MAKIGLPAHNVTGLTTTGFYVQEEVLNKVLNAYLGKEVTKMTKKSAFKTVSIKNGTWRL